MNGRLLCDSLCGKAAVINGCSREFVVALPVELDKHSNISLLQSFIQKNSIPLLGNGILSAVPGTFWVFVNTFIALFLSSRWSKIEFFLSCFIAVLLCSAVAASAYMSCSRMYNDYDGIQHDYTRKHRLISVVGQ